MVDGKRTKLCPDPFDPFEPISGGDHETTDAQHYPYTTVKRRRINDSTETTNDESSFSATNLLILSAHDSGTNATTPQPTPPYSRDLPIFRIDEPIVSPSATDFSDDIIDNGLSGYNNRLNSLGFANGVVYPPASDNPFDDEAVSLPHANPRRLNSLGFVNEDLDTKVSIASILRNEEEFWN